MVAVGDSVKDIPEYAKPLKANDGTEVTLSSFLGETPVVIFFYPKASTPGCTKEACSFRDEYSSFTAKAKVFGISSDSIASQGKFATNQSLPYPLLSDEGGKLRKALGVKGHLLGLIPGRQTFVIDKEGKVLLAFNNLSHKDHVKQSLAALDKAAAEAPAAAPAAVPAATPAETTTTAAAAAPAPAAAT